MLCSYFLFCFVCFVLFFSPHRGAPRVSRRAPVAPGALKRLQWLQGASGPPGGFRGSRGLQGQGLAGSRCWTGNPAGGPVERDDSDEGDADGDAGGLGPLR